MSSTLTLNSNLASLRAQRRLAQSTQTLQSTFEHLSSGLRITKASDDAAGLAIASSLNVDGRVYSQGVRNTNDAVSFYSIAEGALDSLVDISTRLKELAQQSSNGVLSFTQRKSLDAEAQALGQEYRRITWTTSFNGQNLFDNTNGTLGVQVGYSQLALIGGIAPTGTYKAAITLSNAYPEVVSVLDINGDSIDDIISVDYFTHKLAVFIANGDGTFQSQQTYATATLSTRALSSGDLNGDGKVDLVVAGYNPNDISVLIGNGNGTFQAAQSYNSNGHSAQFVTVGDLNNDGILDLLTGDSTTDKAEVILGNGDGSFKAAITFTSGAWPRAGLITDLNNDGKPDFVVSDSNGADIGFYFGNGDGTFRARLSFTGVGQNYQLLLADVNGDGRRDIVGADAGGNDATVLLANGDGTFQARLTFSTGSFPNSIVAADVNGDGRLDLVTSDYFSDQLSVLFGNGNGTFKAAQTYRTGNRPTSVAGGDFNQDGRFDLVTADGFVNQVSVYFGNGVSVGAFAPQVGFYSLLTQQDSKSALTQFTGVINSLTSALGQLGANSSRLGIVTNVLKTSRENYIQAASQIQDVDVASEAAQLTKTQILQQAGAAILGQANQQPQVVLSLLGKL